MFELKESINELREDLYCILEQRGYNFSDPLVIEASDDLNNAIIAYSALLELKVV